MFRSLPYGGDEDEPALDDKARFLFRK
jgi:hypothetical protein